MKNFLNIVYGVLIGLLAAGIIWLAASRPRGEAVALLPSPTPASLAVYVTGAVVNPGLYHLPPGSRVADAVDAAGGFSANAETDRINLAASVANGEQVDVPGVSGNEHIILGRININTATADELDTLPGIGPTTAQEIVDYRTQNGPFQTIQDIMNVPGVGPSTYDLIKNLITVGP
ncbi:MAG: competence protein ComEA [Anaerolineaceae bacterium]|nr:MAG: competence protein ComEA [Anaerolineaceae bacterium]